MKNAYTNYYTVNVSLKLTPEVNDKLMGISKKTKLRKSDIIRDAINSIINNY